jgi:hypothetical protein
VSFLVSIGVLAPVCSCARNPVVMSPDSLVAALPRTVPSAAPVFANGMRSDSLQVLAWDGTSLFVNGERIFTAGEVTDRLPGSAPPEGVKRAERLGPRKAPPDQLAPAHLAGNVLAPLLTAIDEGRLVFIGPGYFAAFTGVQAALDQIARAVEQGSPGVPGPVSPRLLRVVIEAGDR